MACPDNSRPFEIIIDTVNEKTDADNDTLEEKADTETIEVEKEENQQNNHDNKEEPLIGVRRPQELKQAILSIFRLIIFRKVNRDKETSSDEVAFTENKKEPLFKGSHLHNLPDAFFPQLITLWKREEQ